MGLGYSLFVRPFIALMDSERAHSRAILGLKILSFTFLTRFLLRVIYRPKNLRTETLNLNFTNPLGLAAGMDKKAEVMHGWENLGFGFIEIGGVTEHKQEGNPKPRMFRSSKHNALINRMGFNNPGSEAMQKHLANSKQPNVPLFLNVGKSKVTPLEDAHLDYAKTVERCEAYVDGFVINVSSPNTPNLRDLQKDEDLLKIINEVKRFSSDKPVLVKIAPDLTNEQIIRIVDTSIGAGCQGIVATNTTIERPDNEGIMTEQGGLSGKPLNNRSTEIIRLIADHTDGKWPIIGVGGISTAQDAWDKITNGASLIQIYSAMVFKGPSVIKEIVNGLNKKLKQNNLTYIQQAVGLARRS